MTPPQPGKRQKVQRYGHDPPKRAASGPSGPNSVQVQHPKPSPFQPPKQCTEKEIHRSHHVKCSTHELRPRTYVPIPALSLRRVQLLLRKEVIQPHLPVRLPCYDLVLITDPTFDSSLLAVGPLASGVTDFHDLTGGVYKTRERIHRSVADLRLLATPTS